MSPALKVLSSRATRCSFSSIYHLRGAGHDTKQAKEIEGLFKGLVIVPLAGMAAAGCVAKTWI
tara:strand:+ start:543 stop:731 length:189 start_codon:yes stop_codon:yes gene_type:complete